MKVKDLVAMLQNLDQDLDVEMAMNQEYQCPVDADMVGVAEYAGRRYVLIDNAVIG